MIELLEEFKRLKVAVAGDLILDKYIWGDVSRISPEAPVPVVRAREKSDKLGGAGNTAQVVRALEASVCLFGRLGTDAGARKFEQLLCENSVELRQLPNHNDLPTTVKTRVIAGGQHVVRIDEEDRTPVKKAQLEKIKAELVEQLSTHDALLISDYGKGVFSPHTLPSWIELAAEADLPVVVDPYTEHFPNYRGATIMTPNEEEFLAGMQVRESQAYDLARLAEEAINRYDLAALLVTRGEKGMTLFDAAGGSRHLETEAREVYDVTGAGDTVAGVVCLGEALGADREQVIKLANVAAGLVVGRMGTASVSASEIKEVLD